MRHLVSGVCLTLVFIACTREQAPSTSSVAARPVSTSGQLMSAFESLDRMDTRRPVPLLPMMADHQKQNMRDHLVAVQEIVAALAGADFPAVERAAGRIGYSEDMAKMCDHMGTGAPDFSQQASAFHRQADGIVQAARAQDPEQVLAELGATLQTCTSCHAAWKQQVVTEETWQSLSMAAMPAHGEHRP